MVIWPSRYGSLNSCAMAPVEYKKGSDKRVVDALSRVVEVDSQNSQPDFQQDCTLFLLCDPNPIWLDTQKDSYQPDVNLQKLIHSIESGDPHPNGFSLNNGLLLYKKRIYLPSNSSLKPLVLKHIHNSPVA